MTSRKRIALLGIAVVLPLNLFAAPTASAGDARIEPGRYKECRAPYAHCESVIRDGSVIKILDQHHYRYKKESEWRKGRFYMTDEYRLHFTKGPLHNQLSNDEYKCSWFGDIICSHRDFYDVHRGWKRVDSD